MILLIEPDTSPAAPFPELSAINYVRPRDLVAVGGPPIFDRLPKNLTFEARDGEGSSPGLADFMRGVGFVLMSRRLRSALEEVGAEIEYVPIVVRYKGSDKDGFFVANPLRRIEGVNLQASEIELDEVGIALSVEHLVLDEAKFHGVPLAVVHETMHLAAQEYVVGAIQAAGCTGCDFKKADSVRF